MIKMFTELDLMQLATTETVEAIATYEHVWVPDGAWIPEGKLEKYVLNPGNHKDPARALWFAAELGIEQKDWLYLHDQILEVLPEYEAVFHRATAWGATWEVVMPIVGLNSSVRAVKTGWIVHPWDPRPSFTTAYPAKRRIRVVDRRIPAGRATGPAIAHRRPARRP